MDAAQAAQVQAKLADLADYIRSRFPAQVNMTSAADAAVTFASLANYRPDLDPTGQEYTPLPSLEACPARAFPTLDEAINDLRQAFDGYARHRHGTLYWRVLPEIEFFRGAGWRGYMRLTITDKPAKET